MTVTIEDLLRWQPNSFGEDLLDNLILNILTQSNKWHLVYYNPPHGSWKSLTLVKDNYEYRQVGPKRGREKRVERMRRPDIAFQFLEGSRNCVRLFLVESKIRKEEWNKGTPTLMRSYFEGVTGFGESKGVRLVPIRHRRKRGDFVWDEIQPSDPDREWFRKIDVEYSYGFVYSIGLQSRQYDPSADESWIRSTLQRLRKPIPPLAIIGAGWVTESSEPFIMVEYSESFPADIREELEKLFSTHARRPKSIRISSFLADNS